MDEIEPINGRKADPNEKTRFHGYDLEPEEPRRAPPPPPPRAEEIVIVEAPEGHRRDYSRKEAVAPVRHGEAHEKARKKIGGRNKAASVEAARARQWKIAMTAIASIAVTLGTIILITVAPIVRRARSDAYKPLDGFLTNYNSKPLLATLNQSGQLYYLQLKGYDVKTVDGAVLTYYSGTTEVDQATALPRFAEILPQLEIRFMNRSLTPETGIDEMKQRKVLSLLRSAVSTWQTAETLAAKQREK